MSTKQLAFVDRLKKCLASVDIGLKINRYCEAKTLEIYLFNHVQESLDAQLKLRLRVNENCTLTIKQNTLNLYSFLRYIGTNPDLSNFPVKGTESDPAKMNALCRDYDAICVQETIKFFDSRQISFEVSEIPNTLIVKGSTLQLAGYYGNWTVNDNQEIPHFNLFNLFNLF
jgi:hypothetical protein